MPREEKTCPRCAARVGPWDTQCLECGAPLIPDRKKKEEDEKAAASRARRVAAAAEPGVTGAAAGRAEPNEDWKKTRMKVYDKKFAEELKKARPAIFVTSVLSLIAGGLLLTVALRIARELGGFSAVFQFDFERLQSLRFLAILDTQVLFFVTAGLTIAAFLGAIGELLRFMHAGHNLALIEQEEPPEIMGVHPASMLALLVTAVFCPLLGIIFGIILRFNRGEDLRELGAQMLYLSGLVVALFLASVIWDVARDAVESSSLSTGQTTVE
ncbi:MAG: hypothetical protein ACLFWB_12425 [Armatimonadota bacterium]